MSVNNNKSFPQNGQSQSMDKAKSEAEPVIKALRELLKKSGSDSLLAAEEKDYPKTPEGSSISK